MDFSCEISSNSQAVFLNYAYWLCCSATDVDLPEDRRAEVLEAVGRCWALRKVGFELPAEGERIA